MECRSSSIVLLGRWYNTMAHCYQELGCGKNCFSGHVEGFGFWLFYVYEAIDLSNFGTFFL